MELKKLTLTEGFRVVRGNRRSQAAEMVIAPGEAEGDARNRHRGADQWLYVIAGSGSARVKNRRYKLGRWKPLLIARGEGAEMNAASDNLS